MDLKLSKIISARGAKGYAPENTLVGIHTAADIGVKWVSLDVKLTKDSVPVLFHDEELERTTTMNGQISQKKWDEIKEVDAGSYFSESFYGESIPHFESALDVILERGLALNLFLQPSEGREEETAEIVLDNLSRIWDDHGSILITSTKPECLDVARHYFEDAPRSLYMTEQSKDWEDLAKQLEVSAITIANTEELANEFTIKAFKKNDYQLIIADVNEFDHGDKLLNLGADALITDVPDIFELEDEDEDA